MNPQKQFFIQTRHHTPLPKTTPTNSSATITHFLALLPLQRQTMLHHRRQNLPSPKEQFEKAMEYMEEWEPALQRMPQALWLSQSKQEGMILVVFGSRESGGELGRFVKRSSVERMYRQSPLTDAYRQKLEAWVGSRQKDRGGRSRMYYAN